MEFLTKRDDYKTTYSKEEAIKQLRDDKRIQQIINTKKGIIIDTHPIYVKSHTRKLNKLYDYPIGSYKIILEPLPKNRSIYTEIIRLEGNTEDEDWQHIHINSGWSNHICWGNMSERIHTMERNKDFYWLVKTCLDILEDGEEDDGLDYSDMNHIIIGLQITFEERTKNRKKIIKELKKRYKTHLKTSYEEGYNMEDD